MNLNLSWHSEDIDKVLKTLEVNPEYGLNNEEYNIRLKKFGKNKFEHKEKFRFLKLLLRQIQSPLVLILIIAGISSLVFFKDYSDAGIIFIAVLFNTIIGIIQEGKASKTFEKLKKYLSSKSNVLRAGQIKEIDSSEIVPGDILIIRQGEKIAADARIIEAKNLEVNEAVLTGEWLTNSKEAGVLPKETPLADRTNMVYSGTTVEEGFGKAVVVGTGEETEIGKISKLLAEEKKETTPLQKGIKNLAKIIGVMVVAFAVLIFGLGIARGIGFEEMFLTSVAIAVASIPEGLPVAVTVILALGMQRILSKGGLVRKLGAAETLGSTDVVLIDKTGTLTQAKMESSVLITRNKKIENFDSLKDSGDSNILNLLKSAMFVNEAFVENPGSSADKLIIRGQPTEKAILKTGIKAGLNQNELLKEEPRIDYLGFNPERKWSASLHKMKNGKARIYLAGAPETILKLSDTIADKDKNVIFSREEKLKFRKEFENLTEKGARVIAFAYKENNYKDLDISQADKIFSNFIFLGLIAFEDPVREDAKEAMELMRRANVRVVMVTGDHKGTAKAVAQKVNMVGGKKEIKIMEGGEIEKISAKGLPFLTEKIDIFARTTPSQKLAIMKAFQDKNYTVAMTGDGVNDALALKRANIGLSVGSGTEVAKEASDLVLINDSFSIISRAIEEGRTIVDNLKKVIIYLLSTSFSEIVLIGSALAFGLPLPLLPGQILWANLIEEGFMNFAFAFEQKEEEAMLRKPKDYSLKKILSREIIKTVLIIGAITSLILLGVFLYLHYINYPLEKLRTIMFAGLAMDALFFAFSIKNLKKPIWKIKILSNPYLIMAWFLSVALLLAALFLPPIQKLLKLTPLSLNELILIASIGVSNLVVIESVKWYNNRNI